jgi:hypothetical protein
MSSQRESSPAELYETAKVILIVEDDEAIGTFLGVGLSGTFGKSMVE